MAENLTGGKRRRGGQPGNRNAIKHGFYSAGLQPAEIRDLDDLADEVNLGDEITMLRVLMRRMFLEVQELEGVEAWSGALGSLGAAATRLAGLLRVQKLIGSNGSEVALALSDALREVTSEITRGG